MIAQQPIGFYIVVKDVETSIRPRVAFWGQSKFDVRRYTQNPSNGVIELDDSRTVNKVANTLQRARPDGYKSLARNQPLVKAGKVSVDEMQDIIDNFSEEM